MYKVSDFEHLELTLAKGKITSIIDKQPGVLIRSFPARLKQKKCAKIYILKEDDSYLYIGTTSQSLSARFRQGFNADGKNGYHGYKWKEKEKVQLYVWCFPDLDKLQIENIEAELAFLIRKKTGRWPLAQNEIHFNNDFKGGQAFAEKLFRWTQPDIK
jgi:predicted GIY-YIG superfamily endonuclease